MDTLGICNICFIVKVIVWLDFFPMIFTVFDIHPTGFLDVLVFNEIVKFLWFSQIQFKVLLI